MKRVLWVLLGVALLVATGVILLRAWQQSARESTATESLERSPAPGAAAPQAEPDIDAQSRAKLEAVLQEHESEEIGPESKAKLEAVLPSETGASTAEEKR